MQKKLKSPMSQVAQFGTFKEVQRDGKEVQRDGKEVQRDGKEVQRDGKEVQRDGKEVQRTGKKVQRDDAWAQASSANSRGRRVTPTSERIIKETSVKRRKAMKVLANR